MSKPSRARADRPRAGGGGAKRNLAPAQEVLRVLIALRHHVAHAVVGPRCGVSAARSENRFPARVPRLRAGLPADRLAAEHRVRRDGPRLELAKTARILIASCATASPRPAQPERQKRVYAGKQKPHTLKTPGGTAAQGAGLAVAAGPRGPAAAKKIYAARGVKEHCPHAAKPGALGSLGTAGVAPPPRNPRGGHLTDAQREAKRRLARVRVHGEHGIGRLQGCKIVRENYRQAMGLFPLVVAAVVGLVHLNRLRG